MEKYDLLIRGGTVILPDQLKEAKLNIAVADGKIAALCDNEPDAESVIDAGGLYVSPGFIDSHMHDDDPADDGKIVEQALLRQGVTTAIAGNCGTGPLAANIRPARQRPWLNLGYLTGHQCLREAVGVTDTYTAASKEQLGEMKRLLRAELENGSFGLSFGLEYIPNTPVSEVTALLDVAADFQKIWIPVHIRSDGPEAIAATDEVLGYARDYKLRFQISHTASMTGFGMLADVLEHIEAARRDGADVTFDCYPYDAFCTHLGSAVFDPGFEARWGKGLESLEIGSGPYRGRWLNEDGLYKRLRKDSVNTLIIAHVIHADEVELCLKHPDCIIASDSILINGHGHPRAAGTFPRALGMLRGAGFSWPEAIRKCTSLPAEANWLEGKGVIKTGADADFVIFDGEALKDNATFTDQLLPPDGIEWVIIAGESAVRGKEALGGPKGRLLSRQR